MEEELLSLTDIIKNTINDILSQIFSSIDNNLYSILDTLAFVDTSILDNKNLLKILGTSPSEGILLLCNSLFFGFLIYYAANYLISHFTLSKIDSPPQFIFKSIIFLIFMNSSNFICSQIINIISISSSFILYIGETIFNKSISFTSFINSLNEISYVSTNSLDIFSFSGIIKSFISYGLINILFSLALRYIMIQILILICPFAFLSLVNSKSEWFFKSWLKCFVSLLLLQILISLILVVNLSINSINPALSIILNIGTIYALSYSNSYLKTLIGGFNTTISTNISYIKNSF